MKTSVPKPMPPQWFLFDATGEVLGRLAVRAAMVLRGKHKPAFSPHALHADHVVVVHAAAMKIEGKKGIRRTYARHTGYPGRLKVRNLAQVMERDPRFAVTHAVKGMLPRNRLREQMLKRLHVFADGQHPYAAQKPQSFFLTQW